MRVLGKSATYVFCGPDPESAATLRDAAAGFDARVIEADGVSTITREAQLSRGDPGDVLVHIDPFDPYERTKPDSKTPLELAGWLARVGCRLFYWYGYDSVEQRGWARHEISRLAPGVALWCGDVLIPASLVYPGRPTTWGCGVVLANRTNFESHVCELLGRGLERISETDVHEGNDPARVTFSVVP
jgi:hypothetical protein